MTRIAWSIVWFSACGGGTVSPDPPTQSGALDKPCPTIPQRIGSCSDFHLMDSSLTCGGDGTMKVAIGMAPGGANRFTVQLVNGSRVLGSLVHNDPPCNIRHGTDADFTFGVVYTGDQGVEIAADGTRVECIVQSKMEFSSFNFDHVGMAPHEGRMKQELHAAFDKEVIDAIYRSDGKPPLAGRCVRWRQMP